MKFFLYQDETLEVNLPAIAENLNRLFDGAVSFVVGKSRLQIPGSFLTNPNTYQRLFKSLNFKAEVVPANVVLHHLEKAL